MGKLNIGAIVYDNPRQVDQTTVIDPRTGRTWQAAPVGYRPGDPISPQALALFQNGRGVSWASPDTPQPGSFDPTPTTANPVLMNVDPPVAGKGKPISVSGGTASTGNPVVDLNRKVVGQVPNGPAFANPS